MKQSRHYMNELYHFCPVMLTNRKLDIPCKLDILHDLLFTVNCIKKKVEVMPHTPVATGLLGCT